MYKGGTAGKKELQERTICIQNKRVEALQAVFSRSNAVGNVEERERERKHRGETRISRERDVAYRERELWVAAATSTAARIQIVLVALA